MTKCNAVGALMVGGRVVGQIRCELRAGHCERCEWERGEIATCEDLTHHHDDPHRAVLEWTPESDPDLDLFDPAERFDAEVPLVE